MMTSLERRDGYFLIRVPETAAAMAGLAEGTALDLSVTTDGSLVLRPAADTTDIDRLIALITPENRHDETDWGPAVGQEAW